MVREISAGGVVLRRMQDQWWIAAIEPQSENTKSRTVWALPKGLVDPGESAGATAIREVREETGLEAVFLAKLADIKYVYVRTWGDGERVFKIVSFFLLKYLSGEIGNIGEDMRVEVRRAEWMPLNEAPKRLSYSGEKKVAKMALDWVQQQDAPTLANL